jgi:hypothetical protein
MPATLTVYRDGLINLNAKATRLMHRQHVEVDLLPPATARQPWRLDRRAGCCCKLVGRADRGNLRFRAPYRADELFRDLPAEQDRQVLELVPLVHGLNLYELRPVAPKSAVQHFSPADSSNG